MIIGIGIDLCNEKRISKVFQKHSYRFINRICSKKEILRVNSLHSQKKIIRKLSGMFAAKEATAKALGVGFKQSVYWRDIETYSDKNGKPLIKLYGGALDRQNKLIPNGYISVCHVSMTRESGTSSAIVIIEALLQ